MAITFVAAGAKGEVNGTSVAVGIPAGIQDDDVGILGVAGRGDTATISDVTGWTGSTQVNHSAGNSHIRTRVFRDILAASDGNPTIAQTVSQSLLGGIAAFRGVDTTTPFDVAIASGDGESTTMTAPAVTTVTAGCMIVRVFMHSYGISAHSAHSDADVALNFNTILGVDASLSMSYALQGAAGDTGTETADAGGSNKWIAYTIALRPVANPPAVTFDDITYLPGETLTVTASPVFGGTITTFTAEGGDTFTVSGASAATASVAIPAITQFVSGGTANNTRLRTLIDGTVGDGTDTAIAEFKVDQPAGYFLVTLAADYASLSAAAQEWVPASAVTGDDLLVSATVGTIVDVTVYGEIAWSTLEGTARVVHYVVGTSSWSAVTAPTFGPGYAFPSLTSNIPSIVVRAGATVTIDINDWFDGDAEQFTITYSVFSSDNGLPTGSSLDSSTGILTVVGPTDLDSYPGIYSSIVIRLADGADTSDSNAFQITVRDAYDGAIALSRPIAGNIASPIAKRIAQ